MAKTADDHFGVREGGVAHVSQRPARSEGEVKSAARTIELLELLATQKVPLTLTEIAQLLPMPLSSLHQLLKTLVVRGWLSMPAYGNSYTIGVRALVTGMSFIERDPVVQAGRPMLAELRTRLGETVHLARLVGASVVYLASAESEHQLRNVSRVGQTIPAHATALGKAALATKPSAEVSEILPEILEPMTVKTLVELPALLSELEHIRVRGWAQEFEENTAGTACVGVAIPGTKGPYALSCSVPLARMNEARTVEISNALLVAARQISSSVSPIGIV